MYFEDTAFMLKTILHKLPLSPKPGARKMEYKGNSWHETCFLCHRCQQPIGTKSFIPKDSGYFCVPCFEKQYAYQCCACKKVAVVSCSADSPHMWHTKQDKERKERKEKQDQFILVFLSSPGHHNRRGDLSGETLASRVFPVHQLQEATVRATFHNQGKLPLLP